MKPCWNRSSPFPSRASRSRTCLIVSLQPTAWPSGPSLIEEQEPAVGLEPTWSALRGRCPACRASPACESSQCWCRANSTEVQSLRPLPRAWPEEDPEPAAGLEPARAPLQEGCSSRRATLASEGGRRESNPHNPVHRRVSLPPGVRPQCSNLDSNQELGLRRAA